MPEHRRKQMNSALKLTLLFLSGYGFITQQVVANTWIRRLDEKILERDFLRVTPENTPLLVQLIDDLGLRSVTSIILIITAILISRRFKSWRPINLSILALLLLNSLALVLNPRSKDIRVPLSATCLSHTPIPQGILRLLASAIWSCVAPPGPSTSSRALCPGSLPSHQILFLKTHH